MKVTTTIAAKTVVAKAIAIAMIVIMAGVALSTAARADTADTDNRFALADVFELEYASSPEIAPDGDRIVYQRNFMDIMKDVQRSNLWIVSADGTDHRPLTSGNGNHMAPRWSPSGDRLVYVVSEDGAAQLYVRWMDTGQSAKITNLLENPGNIAWSPDGKWIAFTMLVPTDAAPLAEMPTPPEGAEWAKPARVIDEMIYRADGAGYLERGYTQLFIVPADGGTPRQLTQGDFDHDGMPSWSPDGRTIVISANRHDNHLQDPLNSEIYEVNIADGAMTPLTDRAGPDAAPAVSPDGRRIAYIGFDDTLDGYQVTQLYVMERDGSNPRLVSGALDRDVQDPVWSADGRRIYFLYDDRGNTRLASATLDGDITVHAENVGGLSLGRPYSGGAFSLAGDGRFAFTHTAPDHPADVAIGGRGDIARLTRLNDDLFGHKALGAVEEITYESSADGRQIQGWIIKPPAFDENKKYPLILEIHGGPFANYGARFTAESQLYAAAGYVVLYINPRGSTSYGKEFGNLIHHNYPGEDYDDLISGVDAVLARGYVDENNLFVTGGSGGGVLTSWIVGKTDRFRAAVVAKPVINWISFALTSDAYNFFYKYWFEGYPWEHVETYWKRSPLSLVGNVTTPTMLLTGEADYRTPISETEQYYQALKLRGIETAMVRVPGASHGIARRPSNLIAKVANILAWFERYRTNNKKETADSAP